jgi:hypothetical protein
MRRKVFKADRRWRRSFGAGRPGFASFRTGERVFRTQEIEHRAPDPVSRISAEL